MGWQRDRFKKMFSQMVGEHIWAIHPESLKVICNVIESAQNGVHLTQEEIKTALGFGGQERAPQAGVAVIRLVGPITHRSNLMSEYFGGATVEGFRKNFRNALADSSVNKILIDIDSPGGTVDGIQELADEIFNARGQGKTITAIANTMAASAAYWVASAADEFSVTPSGDVGSIGVFTVHMDHSKSLESIGVVPTIISAGKFKVEGNPFGPLSEEAKENIQSQVDTIYNQFLKAVAKNRGVSVSEAKSSFGQGRTVMAKQAAVLGMVDRVETFGQAVSRLLGKKAKGSSGNAFAVDTDAMKLELELQCQ